MKFTRLDERMASGLWTKTATVPVATIKAHVVEARRLEAYLHEDNATTDDFHRFEFLRVSSVATAAFLIESWANALAVGTLGFEFFDANIERLSAVQKLAVVGVILTRKIPSKENLGSVRRLFEERNAIVHPKTRPFDPKDLREGAKSLDLIYPALRDALKFIKAVKPDVQPPRLGQHREWQKLRRPKRRK